jgi:hypothetical protein
VDSMAKMQKLLTLQAEVQPLAARPPLEPLEPLAPNVAGGSAAGRPGSRRPRRQTVLVSSRQRRASAEAQRAQPEPLRRCSRRQQAASRWRTA